LKAFFYGLYHACVVVDYNLQSVFSVPVSSATKREDIYRASKCGCKNALRFFRKKEENGDC